MKMDQRIGQLRCGKCGTVFNKISSLSRHEKMHWAALRCARDGCEKAFSSHKDLYKHLKRHSDTNLVVRIVPFNIWTKIEVKQELSDGASRQQSVQQLKNIKKEEEDAELRVKNEVKNEHDQTGEKEIDRGNSGQIVGGCVKKRVKKEEKEDDDYCGCKECIREKVTSDDDRVSGTSLPPVPSDDGQFGTGHSQIGLDGDTPSNSASLYQLIGGEKLDTKLWLRGVIDLLVDPMIDSLYYRLIRSSSTASITPQRSSTVLKLCQLIEGQKKKTNRLLQIDMDRVVNSLFLRLTNKALVNLDRARSVDVNCSSQLVNPSNPVESPNAQSHQQSSFITQPSTSSTSSFNPHQTHVSELMFQLIAAERVDLKLWLRVEIERLADLTIDSLFFRLIMSSSSATSVSPQRCSTGSELCQLMEGEEKKMNSSIRKEIDRLVHSLLERLKNKLLVRTAGSENVDHRSQVNLLNNVESANPESHQPSSFIPQPSSSTSVIDEFEPEIIGEIGEGNVEVLQNVPNYTSTVNRQSGDLIDLDEFDEQDQSCQDGHIALSHKVNSSFPSTGDHHLVHNTNNERLEDQTIDHDHQQNGQANNVTDDDTHQNWDNAEIEEGGDDAQMMEIEQEEDEEGEDKETKIDSDNCEKYENNQDEESTRLVANPSIDPTLASKPSPVMKQSARLPKRKHTENELPKNRDNQEDTGDEQEVTSRADKRSRPPRPNSYIHPHKRHLIKKCKYPECQFETLISSNMKRHHFFHLGIKPYRCKWSQCDYASAQRSNTINHIHRMHFKGKPSSSVCLGDYVEVNEMRLNNPDGHSIVNVNSTKQNQIITVTLKCPQCDQMFSKHKFNKHMKKKHLIDTFRCFVKDCKESFINSLILGQHLAQSHQSTTQWHCNMCDKHFTSYQYLSNHNVQYHQLGHFQCSFPSCTFTADYKKKVSDHYHTKHRTKALSKCQHPGCQYETPQKGHLKQHQQVHLGIKPYKCKWPLCNYAATKNMLHYVTFAESTFHKTVVKSRIES